MISQNATTPVRGASLFGLALCLGSMAAPGEKHPFEQAFEFAKETGKPLVVVRYENNTNQSWRLAISFQSLIDGERILDAGGLVNNYFFDLDAHELLAEAVFVFVADDELDTYIKKTVKGEDFISVDESRTRVAGAKWAKEHVLDAGHFVELLSPLIHGGSIERLAERGAAARKKLSDETRVVFEKFMNQYKTDHEISDARVVGESAPKSGELPARKRGAWPADPGATREREQPKAELIKYVDSKVSDADRQAMLDHLHEALPWLIWERAGIKKDNKNERAKNTRLRALIETAFESADRYQSEPQLPFGVKAKVYDKDPCPTCGMAAVSRASRMFEVEARPKR
ncbi:MAG: hypothetical protein HY286_17015 [Planctomycetes bacterium]|nr:hypothetical protein [Planctomycetota bacterium]